MVKWLRISNFDSVKAKSYTDISDSLNQYANICRDAFKNSYAKLNKRFERLLIETLLLYMIIPRRINFTQMARYGNHCGQTFRNFFNRKLSESINWLSFNLSLTKRILDMDGLLAIAVDPSYICKAGKMTAHTGTFWSGCANAMKHGLEIMGIGLVDVKANSCMMLRAHQTPGMSELRQRNKNLVQHYIGIIKRYGKILIQVTDIVVADAYFSTSTFVNGIEEYGFHLVSRFRDNADLRYLYAGPRTGKRGRPKTIDGKIDYGNLDLSRMDMLNMEGLEGKACTLEAYSKAMKRKVRLVIWIMPNKKHKTFFSTKLSMTGEEILLTYRSRFQIEFCFRDAKQFAGLTHCQARHSRQLDFSYNASFSALNIAKVMMKENGLPYSMASFKSLMFNAYYTKRIFDVSHYRPNQTLISKIFKEPQIRNHSRFKKLRLSIWQSDLIV